jgi:hypothetical protein
MIHPGRERLKALLIPKIILHLQYSMSRLLQIPLIQEAHDSQVLFTFFSRSIIKPTAMDSQKIALGAYAELFRRLYQPPPLF